MTENNKQIAKEFWGILEKRFNGEEIYPRHLLAEDMVWHLPACFADTELGSELRGSEIYLSNMANVSQIYTPGSAQFTFHNWIAEGDYVHVHFSLRAQAANGKPYENDYQALMRFRDGKLQEAWEYCDTAYWLQVFS